MDDGDVAATDFVLGIAVESFRTIVPGQNRTVQRGCDDRVVGALDNGSELVQPFLGLFSSTTLLAERLVRCCERACPPPRGLLQPETPAEQQSAQDSRGKSDVGKRSIAAQAS